ncbi:alpha/beta fold hydrolase [Roseomonas elaeocarpi]|uniref:Alpha/beta fold hydrolase n=1 Tax=Roseomonas elaeocarpi TaxID=907779 RepID=A0ABV6JN14_9PROT
MALPGRTRGGLEWYRTLAADHATALEYKKQPPDMPLLGLGGGQRFGTQMVPMLKEFATNVTGGSIVWCSHYVAEEQPDEVAAALIEFLKAS